MKNLVWLPSLLLIFACSEKDSTVDDSHTVSEPTEIAMSAPVDAAPVVQNANLPWDIPTMPNARVIHDASHFSPTTERRGGESTALIATDSSAAEIVGFYKQALPELGFKVTHSRNLDDSSSRLNAEAEDGRTFQIFANLGGSNAQDGESSASLVATMPKLTE